MKSIHIYAFALLSALLMACSDDDSNMNSSADVKVSFEHAEISFNENAGIVTVPLKIEGEPNGDIRVTVKTTDGSAIAQGHYILTDKTIIIPLNSDETSFGCEFRLLDDGEEENDDRTFTVSIENVEGAATGAISTCSITLLDVDKNPYFKLQGDWTLNATNAVTGAAVSFDVNISNGGDEANNEKSFVFTGFWNVTNSYAPLLWTVEYKASGTLSVVAGPWYTTTYNFGSFTGKIRVMPLDWNTDPMDKLDEYGMRLSIRLLSIQKPEYLQ